jgi:small ligand-binding sensory domain FIST
VAADEDLRGLLDEVGRQFDPGSALLFTCNGRGARMFRSSHHDASCIEGRFPGLPLAGFFAAGELGPVGRRNFLHGFTASVALFGKE